MRLAAADVRPPALPRSAAPPIDVLERLALASLKARSGEPEEAFRAAELLKARSLLAALARSDEPEPPVTCSSTRMPCRSRPVKSRGLS